VRAASIGVFNIARPSGVSVADGQEGGQQFGLGTGVVPDRKIPCSIDPIDGIHFLGQTIGLGVPSRPGRASDLKPLGSGPLTGRFVASPCQPVPIVLQAVDLYQYRYPCGCGQQCARYIPDLTSLPTGQQTAAETQDLLDAKRVDAFYGRTLIKWTIEGYSSDGFMGCFRTGTPGYVPCETSGAALPQGGMFPPTGDQDGPTILYAPPALAPAAAAKSAEYTQRIVRIRIRIFPQGPVTLNHYGTGTEPLTLLLELTIARKPGLALFSYQDVYEYAYKLEVAPGQTLVRAPAETSKKCGCEESYSLSPSRPSFSIAPRLDRSAAAAITGGSGTRASVYGPGQYLFAAVAQDSRTLTYACNPTQSDRLCTIPVSEVLRNHHEPLLYKWQIVDSGGNAVGVFETGAIGWGLQTVAWSPPADLLGSPSGFGSGRSLLRSATDTVQLTIRLDVKARDGNWTSASSAGFVLGQRPTPMYIVALHGAGSPQPLLSDAARAICQGLWPGAHVDDFDAVPGASGINLEASVGFAVAWHVVERLITHGPNQGIIILGHSLGGSAATLAANVLANFGIGVDDLLLYDRYYAKDRPEVLIVLESLFGSGNSDRDIANLTPLARQEVVRRQHIKADAKARQPSPIQSIVVDKWGPARPTHAGRAPIREIQTSHHHTSVLMESGMIRNVLDTWRNVGSDVPVVPVNTCRNYLRRERLREIQADLVAVGYKLHGSFSTRLVRASRGGDYPCR